ncbi:MAG: anthranilate synthase component I family protein [Candidatus Aceula meridiana]|nr:anthranilate synthase component I family protein [Candidatus Aceula meridiana]
MSHEVFYKVFDFTGNAADIFTLFSEKSYPFLLDSSLKKGVRGRFSFIGFEPFEIFSASGKDSLYKLAGRYQPYQVDFKNSPTPFAGGLVGFLGYDLGLSLEGIVPCGSNDFSLPDCFFGFYDGIIVLDHLLRKLYVVATGLPERNPALAKRNAKAKIDDIAKCLDRYSPQPKDLFQNIDWSKTEDDSEISFQNNFTRSKYVHAVEKVLGHIAQGDIYQVNLSQRFLFENRFDFQAKPFELYQTLSTLSPANFGAYFDAQDFQIISHSPEEFLRLKDNHVYTCPMKGTRPRGKDIIEDEIMKNELLTSAKERAELLMVTDLERNDLGRVCDYGSVGVQSMRTLEEYATVFQTISVVEGNLRKDKGLFDLIKACFPSGSVTGCPKIRSMQIIDQIEQTRRGPYTGSLGYIGFNGDMDFNILIRTLVKKDNQIFFHAGGGIVADSVPEREYEETLVKAKALRRAIQQTFLKKIKV